VVERDRFVSGSVGAPLPELGAASSIFGYDNKDAIDHGYGKPVMHLSALAGQLQLLLGSCSRAGTV